MDFSELIAKLPDTLQAIFVIVGGIFSILVTFGFLDRSNRVVKVYDKIGEILKKFSKKEKK